MKRLWLTLPAFLLLATAAMAASQAGLTSGAHVVSVATPAPTEILLTLPAGSRLDPPGRHGAAELTALVWSRGGEGHAERLEAAASSASVLVGPRSTSWLLTGLKDGPGALRLLSETLGPGRPTLATLLAMRRRMAWTAVDASASSGETRRWLAASRLTGEPDAFGRAFEILGLHGEDVAGIHGGAYGPESLRLTIVGSDAPVLPDEPLVLADLPEPFVGGLAAWTARKEAALVPRMAELPGGEIQPVIVAGAREAGGAVAFRVTAPGPAFLALLAAADADPTRSWLVEPPAASATGSMLAQEGDVFVVDCLSAEPDRAVRALLTSLERLGRKRPSASAMAALRKSERFVPAARVLEVDECLAAGRGPEACTVAGLLEEADAEAIQAAAKHLAAGPRSIVLTVNETDLLKAGTAWKGAVTTSLGRPVMPEAQEKTAEARRWVDDAVAAHGGEALKAVTGFTVVVEHVTGRPDSPKQSSTARLDMTTSPVEARYEHRLIADSRAHAVMRLKDWDINDDGRSGSSDAADALILRTEIYCQPVTLLQRAASGRFPLQSEGSKVVGGRRVNVVAMADPDAGNVRLEIDEQSRLLLAVSYDVRASPKYPTRTARIAWTEHGKVGEVLLPGRSTRVVGNFAAETVSVYKGWQLRPAGWSPASVTGTTDADISVEEAPAAQE